MSLHIASTSGQSTGLEAKDILIALMNNTEMRDTTSIASPSKLILALDAAMAEWKAPTAKWRSPSSEARLLVVVWMRDDAEPVQIHLDPNADGSISSPLDDDDHDDDDHDDDDHDDDDHDDGDPWRTTTVHCKPKHSACHSTLPHPEVTSVPHALDFGRQTYVTFGSILLHTRPVVLVPRPWRLPFTTVFVWIDSNCEEVDDAYISSFFSAMDEVVATDTGKALSQWKDMTVKAILASPLFATPTMAATRSPANLSKKIRKKFNNHKTQDAIKQRTGAGPASTAPPTAPAHAPARGSFLSSAPLTGNYLFTIERRDAIMEAATVRATAEGVKPFWRYQTCRKEMWDHLSDDERAAYDARALTTARDVSLNQKALQHDLWLFLHSSCESGLLGPIEFHVLYAYRQPTGGLVGGTVCVHTPDNTISLQQEVKDYKASVFDPWMGFASKVLPTVPAPNVNAIEIPRSRAGVPVFPQLNLKEMTPASITIVLKEFFTCLWAFCRPSGGEIPWSAIAANNSEFYDTKMFGLPVPLKNLEALNSGETCALAEWLMQRLDDIEAFVFCPARGEKDAADENGDKGGSEDNKDSDGRPEDKVGSKAPISVNAGAAKLQDGAAKSPKKQTVPPPTTKARSPSSAGSAASDLSDIDDATVPEAVVKKRATAAKSQTGGVATGAKAKAKAPVAPPGINASKKRRADSTGEADPLPVQKKARKGELPAAAPRKTRARGGPAAPPLPPVLGRKIKNYFYEVGDPNLPKGYSWEDDYEVANLRQTAARIDHGRLRGYCEWQIFALGYSRQYIRARCSYPDTRRLPCFLVASARCERDKFQSRLDDYKYPVLTLPAEITSEIFIHFLPIYPLRPPPTGLLSPALLGQICRKWRDVALGTPRL
ncbi:hypothetical protein C8J57DRAFT_1520084 [Mycena rebaudengoi]|nr:hypothetical protein C8J57DRAFT_1520084 [Mycena rebaudengoi]